MKQIALIFVTLHLLFSCSVSYHLNKAIKKGYRCDEISDTIKITSVDSFPVILHDSIVWEKISIQKDTIVRYRTSYVPKTRIEYRMDIKRFNDSMSYIRNMYSDSLDAVIKINKQESKVAIKTRKKSPNLFIIGLLTGIILTLIFKYAINQALKKFTRINF
jgi:hypothetical protein